MTHEIYQFTRVISRPVSYKGGVRFNQVFHGEFDNYKQVVTKSRGFVKLLWSISRNEVVSFRISEKRETTKVVFTISVVKEKL